ncbi:MAG: hypothetical protein CLLPBCKN_007584 [Chroococcidiopsis cubana SAG 39.79]|uniref:Uncharacterized protein n=1 Tax=Chroococcidiopsis cubana SAG 39.79 TaxID=388085 RepID=A0AB37UT49_9CYAN|nr:hypothetical protein [Chroococcidiopsis cubana]MDZ4878149.1 hypothetical protein [Chroococcidiopsis cubana SAG 39.79]RUT14584.1 hypothetical protein DSM107010_01300 [Chroococcidiopsis cubana SAG 39.79]
MYDERATELGHYYTRITDKSVETIYSMGREITNSITEIVKLIFEKLRENKAKQPEELERIRADIGSDTYVLSRDRDLPDAWKWEKLDSVAGQYRAETPTEFQLQAISQRLATDVTDSVSQTNDRQLCLQIVGTTESGKEVVLYTQDETGNCKTNLATQLLTPEELTALTDCTSNVQQPLVAAGAAFSLEDRPEGTSFQSNPSAAEQLDSQDLLSLKQELESNLVLAVELMATRNQKAEELTKLSQTVAASESSARLGETAKDLASIDERIANVFLQSAATIKNYQQQLEKLSSNLLIDRNSERVKSTEVSQDSVTAKNTVSSQPRQASQEKNQNSVVPKNAVEYTYKQVLDSPTIQRGTKQWVRQLHIPIYKILSQKLERQRLASENKRIAKTAAALLKRYGQIQTDGSLLYRSDAFAIIKQGEKFTIHRRQDELQGFKQPLMEFKLERNGTPKITRRSKEMLPAERQEFVMVAERLADRKTLRSLSTSDLREVANTLGSLAPAGTLSTLESFKQVELLGTLNGILQKAKTDKLTVGELTIVRRRDPEHNKASLSLYKTTVNGDRQELVEFQLEKKSEGISQEITKMNISEQDINYIKLMAQKAQLFDLEQLFNSANSNSSSIPTARSQQLNENQEIKGIGELALTLHPFLAQEWNNIQREGQPSSNAMMQGNDEINQKIRANSGKLSIAEQREMYFKIVAAKVAESESKAEKGIDLIPLKQIMKDLQQQRQQVIQQIYTPKSEFYLDSKVADRTNGVVSQSRDLSL